jgi:hypothetical protein
MSAKYEVTMGPAAHRAVLNLLYADRKGLADALRTELLDGPNADKEIWFDADMRPLTHPGGSRVYVAVPLTFDAYVAVHRPMTKEELGRLGKEQHRRVAAAGFFVLDILGPGTAFSRGPRVVGPPL